jgi:hypothetical protein
MYRRLSLTWKVRTLVVAMALVLSLPRMYAQSSAATVIDIMGQVSIRVDGYEKALNLGNTVKPQQMIVTGPGGFARFKVSDGSTFEVYQNSRVIFRESLGDWTHLLNVWFGRVKVFIQHAPGVPNPNNVTSPTAVISVRGTVFDVVVEDDDGTTFVTVDEGSVAVRNQTAPGNPAILAPGDSIRVFRGQPLLGKQIDKGNILRKVLQAAQQAIYQAMIQRPTGGVGAPGGTAPGGGPNGDKGKPGTGGDSGNGGKTGTPGTAPQAPGTAPPPPGGGGGD